MKALIVDNLSKSYGSISAVSNVSFQVNRGEIFGILGPNGAGKTSTLEIIEGLRKSDRGNITIAGINLGSNYRAIKEIIGVQLQDVCIYSNIKLYEVLDLFASYYKRSHNIDYILKLLSLEDKRNSYFSKISGGQKQRLSLGIAIINDPKVIFLDEPTSGIDPHERRNIWDIIKQMKKAGKSIILSTHYMEEAQSLCDRVAIMNGGKIIDMDTPDALIKKHNLASSINFTSEKAFHQNDLLKIEGVIDIKPSSYGNTIFARKPMQTLNALMELARTKNIRLEQITLKEPNLEDLFLELTGKELIE